MVRDPNLRTALDGFVKAALTILITKTEQGEQIPTVQEKKVVFDHSGRLQFGTQIKKDWTKFATKWRTELEDLESFERAVVSFSTNQDASRHMRLVHYIVLPGSTDDSAKTITIRLGELFVMPFLSRLIETSDSLEFSQEKFDLVYRQLEAYLAAEELPHEQIAPIHNFECAIDDIVLSDDLAIRIPTERELHEMANNPFVSYLELIGTRFVVAYKTKKTDPKYLFERIQLAISSLRLWKTGDFSVTAHFTFNTLDWEYGAHRVGIGEPQRALHDTYILTDPLKFQEFFRSIEEFTNRVSQSGQMRYINVAIRRFNACNSEIDSEDRLIDAMIALEALYLGDNESTSELGYRLSLRTAALLGSTYDEARHIQTLVKSAYDRLRSKVVHGRQIGTLSLGRKEMLASEVLDEILGYVRRSIRVFLKLSKVFSSHDEILKAIEDAILSESARASLRAAAED